MGMGLLYGKNCTILTSTVFGWLTCVTDRGWMDGRAIAYRRYQDVMSTLSRLW